MVERFSLAATGNLSFGEGVFGDLPAILAQKGYRRVGFVTSRTFYQSQTCSSFLDQCDTRSVSIHPYPVSGEPTVESIDALVDRCVSDGCDVVVGVGGGSALDTAKAVSVMARYRTLSGETVSVKRFLEGVGDKLPPNGRLPLVAVPTTAGTGSEATKNAVIASIGPHGFKKSLRHDSYIPDLVIIDPALALTVPHGITAAAGLDALTQLLEAYVSVKANPFIDALALQAISLIGHALPRLLDGALDRIDLRSDMAYAAYISGYAIANTGLGYVHGFAGPLGGLHAAPHGAICGTLIGPIHRAMVYEAERTDKEHILLEKFCRIASLWDVDGAQGVVEHIETLVDRAGLPSLDTYGFTKGEVLELAEKDLSRNSPIKLPKDVLIPLLERLF